MPEATASGPASVSRERFVATAEWPNDDWVHAMSAGGWRPHPITQFVLKLAGRCNLACDYCYVYTGRDQSWLHRPGRMSDRVLAAAVGRIAEHSLAHEVRHVKFVLHGGEPLLVGPRRLADVVQTIRSHLPRSIAASFSVQTNGILLNEAILSVLHAQDVRVGVSLDGDPGTHDRHRVWPDHRGSYGDTLAGLQRLCRPEHRDLFSGLLAVVDPDTSPVGVYESLLAFSPPSIDFLLPHAHWSALPPARSADRATPYGDWLTEAFDRWYGADHVETHVVLFEEIANLLLGGSSRSEQVGLAPVGFLVVDTDGSLQQTDALKVVRAGEPETGLNVFAHSIDEVLAHPMIVARQVGKAALADACLHCEFLDGCGGGHFAHRYDAHNGYLNPSVYCADMIVLVRHIKARLIVDIRRGSNEDPPPVEGTVSGAGGR